MSNKNGLYCEVCGKRLPVHLGNRICSAACRQRRARDKRDARKRAIMAAETIENFNKLLTQGVIDTSTSRELLHEINSALHKFWDNIQAQEDIERAKEAQRD